MKPGKQLSGLFRVCAFGGCQAPVVVLFLVPVLLLGLLLPFPQFFSETPSKPLAPELFEQAVQLRTSLESKPKRLRSSGDYLKVVNKYRAVYYQFPTSSKADDALLAVAELYQLMGSDLQNARNFQQAIQTYIFLEREYPASPYAAGGLFTAAEIYLNDLNDADSAQEVFKDFLTRYPSSKKARNARARLSDLRTQPKQAKKASSLKSGTDTPIQTSSARANQAPEISPKIAESLQEATSTAKAQPRDEDIRKPLLVEAIRYWNTEDYTRLVISTEREVKYVEGRLDNPTRVFLDIRNVRLSPTLAGKTIVLNDGYVNKIRFGQSQEAVARVVLELASIKSCQILRLSDPSRIVVDVQGAGRSGQSKSQPLSNPLWKVRHGEPLADELNLIASLPKGNLASSAALEGKKAVEKDEGSLKSSPSIQTKQERSRKPASDKVDEIKTGNVPAALREKESKSVSKASLPKSDGTRSLIRTLGLKVGRIVIDPGHGGHDTGTIGPSGFQEKDLVLDIALKLKNLIEDRLGSEVLLTRTDDTFIPLEERTAMANHGQADLFLSIHANSSRNRRVSGVETFFLDFASSPDAEETAARENSSAQKTIFELQDLVQKIALKEKIEESRELAQIVQKSVSSQLQKAHSQTRDRGVKRAPFIVLIGANMPSILSEVSFMSNPSDEKLLKSSSYRQKLAEALCRGIEAYADALGGLKTARNLP